MRPTHAAEEAPRVASLAERLRERVARNGAITFREFMEAALYDTHAGYYTKHTNARWGRGGDYRTAPEVSRLFAATFARHFAELHAEAGSPGVWTLFEAGAGAGDFARGCLRALAEAYPEVFRATRYVIDEASPDSRSRASRRLAPFADKVSFARLADLPHASIEGIIFANELLDALPPHRVKQSGGRLRELYVGLSEQGEFVWVEGDLSDEELADYFTSAGVTLAEGQCAEACLEAVRWIECAASALRRGHLVTVDYGAEAAELYDPARHFGGTLRGFRRHRIEDDVLARPGAQDITASVSWTHARAAGERGGLSTRVFERQDRFLLRAGALEELERLVASAPGEAGRVALRLGARELILPGGMSESFQVLVQRKV